MSFHLYYNKTDLVGDLEALDIAV